MNIREGGGVLALPMHYLIILSKEIRFAMMDIVENERIELLFISSSSLIPDIKESRPIPSLTVSLHSEQTHCRG